MVRVHHKHTLSTNLHAQCAHLSKRMLENHEDV